MQPIHIDNATVGMVLSADVRDVASRLLASKGVRIQPKHIRIFKIWGVTELHVKGGNEVGKDAEDRIAPAQLKQIEERETERFKHNDLTHPAIQELFQQSVLYRSRHNIPEINQPLNRGVFDAPDFPDRCDLIAALKSKEIVLPEIPSVISELNEAIATPSVSAHEIAEIVNKSPSLTTLLLKIVNSALYSFPSTIDSISKAVTMIGTREITGLASGITAMRMFQNVPGKIIDMGSFSRHSLACGIISRILAAHKNMPQTEQMFVSGLLHDIGRLVIYKYFPDHAKSLLFRAGRSTEPLWQIEKNILGCRHTTIGKYLLSQWKLPYILENNIYYHHHPSAAHDPGKAAIVHLADIMANALGLGSSGERFVPPFDCEAWNHLNLSPGIFRQVIHLSVHQLASLELFLTAEG